MPRAWLPRGGPLDLAISAGLVVWGVVEALSFSTDVPVGARVAFALAATVPLAARAVAPLTVAAMALGAFLFDAVAVVLPVDAVTPLPGLLLAAYAVAAHAEPLRLARVASLVVVPGIPASVALVARDGPVAASDVVALTTASAVAVIGGGLVRSHREEATREATSAVRGRRARERGLREDVLGERFRIAAELRAIVARDLDEMASLLCDAATPPAPVAPEHLRVAADGVQRIAARAVVEMQRLLRALRDDRPQDPGPVTPTTAVDAAVARGWSVVLGERGDVDTTTPGAVVGAARVLEEVLAGPPPQRGGTVTARVLHGAGGIRARLSGVGVAPASLRAETSRARLHQRARLHGGRARTRRRFGRWSIRLELPGTGGKAHRSRLLPDVLVLAVAATGVAADAFAPFAGRAAAVGPATTLAAGALLLVGPLWARRRSPLAVALVLAAGHLLQVLTALLPPAPYSTITMVFLGCHAIARHAADRRRAVVGGLALGVVGMVVPALTLGDLTPPTDLPIFAYMAAASWATGWAARSPGWWALRLRAVEARAAAEHPRQVRAALDGERRRVARDLHDVVAHGVSLAGVLAGGARATALTDPARAAAALATAAETVIETRAELSRLTVVLRVEGDPGPPVSIEDVSRLVDRVRQGGQAVSLDFRAPVGVPHGVAASAYRIVQEALTNARKHAPGAGVCVRVEEVSGSLSVVVENQPAGAPAGSGARQGIAGMHERARLLDGELHVGPTPGGGFLVRARLPLADAGVPAPATP